MCRKKSNENLTPHWVKVRSQPLDPSQKSRDTNQSGSKAFCEGAATKHWMQKGKKSHTHFTWKNFNVHSFWFSNIFNTLACFNLVSPPLPPAHYILLYYYNFASIIISFLLCIMFVNMAGYSLEKQKWWVTSPTIKGMLDPTNTQQSEALDVDFNPRIPTWQ